MLIRNTTLLYLSLIASTGMANTGKEVVDDLGGERAVTDKELSQMKADAYRTACNARKSTDRHGFYTENAATKVHHDMAIKYQQIYEEALEKQKAQKK
ncbi:hypothetical protein PGT21_023736 [Puccinia graminis f. sp. tritici]|uniref:Uncharacterized protein n=3 Tax=Puccinia graminis f. sp. tritici TaxID=56615 RepID=E3KEV6_PUCGT|nr:uncharacterized protein PGTG_09980 [Puccinia graminis f. sp. tritici CRL 75-36-700-3]EFP83012.2 hypothetical protein PGTG_09980 [Puccinia graminis f. sp. tritici CRL 75-36-700-3]KAA1069411.1 hypothetical protein PGT21_023736 [Puccinia graminis f. sp. tritici]